MNVGTPVALLGAGGIGKTAVALTLLDHDHIKAKFSHNRRFISCGELRSYHDFLARLSKVTGVEAENTPDLSALRQFFASTYILLVLDSAETILDPYTPDAPAFYSAIEELSRIKTISLIVTTRISTVPTTCQHLQIPALSMIPAREFFYSIYTNRGNVTDIDSLLHQLDYHPLSINVLATVATQNRWKHPRLIQEWEKRRISLLETHHGQGLTAAIELSLKSPMFTRLGPNARDILGVIAILPQGVNEAELEWIFPTVSSIRDVVDTFLILSITHRNRGFVTILAPVREYLVTGASSHTLFYSTRDQYLTRLRAIAHDTKHDRPLLQDIQWLASEQVNIETILALPTRTNPPSVDFQPICSIVKDTSYLPLPLAHLVDNIRSKPDPIPSISCDMGEIP